MSAFRFGLEAEFLLANSSDWTPLWHDSLSFASLNRRLESIPFEDVANVKGLELEPPHQKLMPFVVEGYHVPDQNMNAVDIRPKGVEIRTSVTEDLNSCLKQFEILHRRLRESLAVEQMVPVSLSHHPLKTKFSGPQNKRRHDFWQWAMEVMTTYGPDINVAVPEELQKDLDIPDLEAKIDFYGPAFAALSAASPFVDGGLWRIREQVGRSFRMYKRSVIAPPIETHPDEDCRLEFKVFDMPASTLDFRCQFLLFLGLLLTPELKGRASRQSRIYDLGHVARFGLGAETVSERLAEFFKHAPQRLEEWGFDSRPLGHFRDRLGSGRTPADEMIENFAGDLRDVLKSRAEFIYESHG